jgi:hypothetical protein
LQLHCAAHGVGCFITIEVTTDFIPFPAPEVESSGPDGEGAVIMLPSISTIRAIDKIGVTSMGEIAWLNRKYKRPGYIP